MLIPLKQGLKPVSIARYGIADRSLNVDSIKTRIETVYRPAGQKEGEESEC